MAAERPTPTADASKGLKAGVMLCGPSYCYLWRSICPYAHTDSVCLGLSLFRNLWDLGMHQVYIVQQSYCSTSTLHVFFKSVPIIPGFSVKLRAVPGASSSTTPCWIRWDKQILGSKSGSVGWSRSNTMHAKESLKKMSPCHENWFLKQSKV